MSEISLSPYPVYSPPALQDGRHGLTLVELLVVIGIMLTMTAVAIPTIRMLTRGDSVREATRVVNLFIESARADASSNGFGGVYIMRDEENSNRATRIYKIHRPQRYTGDFQGVTAKIEIGGSHPGDPSAGSPCSASGNSTFNIVFFADENLLFEPDANGVRGINVNDRIQLDHKGPWYIIQQICGNLTDNQIPHPDDNSRYAYVCEISLSASDFSRDSVTQFDAFNAYVKPPVAYVPYRIERTPVISTRDYVELPKGTYINLTESGFVVQDANLATTTLDPPAGDEDIRGRGAEFSDPNNNKTTPIMVVFRKDGSIDRVDYELNLAGTNIIKSQFPPSSIYFQVASESDTLDPNHDPLDDLDNLWVGISRSNGTVVTGKGASNSNSGDRAFDRAESRRLVRDGQTQNAN